VYFLPYHYFFKFGGITLPTSYNWEMIGAIAALAAIAIPIFIKIYLHIKSKNSITRDLAAAINEEKLQRVRNALSDENEINIWLSVPAPEQTSYYNKIKKSIPIIFIANLKGGVGKTTAAGNLAAYFAQQKEERVLAIDLDFQGSLSSMFIGQANITDSKVIARIQELASKLIRKEYDSSSVIDLAQRLPELNKLDFLPTYYSLAATETSLMLKWLIDEIDSDVRYHLADILLSDEIQNHYDRIIIDGPPRITTSFINGLCSATHLLVPTVLDRLSADAVGAFLTQVKSLVQLCPHLELLGVVGSLVYPNGRPQLKEGKWVMPKISSRELQIVNILEERIESAWGSGQFYLHGCEIQRRTEVSNAAGANIAYLVENDSDFNKMFDILGDEILKRTNKN